ncbi:hypothetical protein [Actinomadura verrucosospora]|uniref:PARP-type domain-containing protein n=1 Tax=Actinomadura verrucosospora TaxID=46165 RepID=A0A7D4A1Y5_ACTVE|nr:hypothetical protein [Actinomadura verrucosospora]QKG20505.1 hypothetical protein ACTIVE_2143 [Actinomadura verrucosospora]
MKDERRTTRYVCAFCTGAIPETSPDLRRVTIATLDGFPVQDLFAHRACVVRAVSPEIPLGEALDEEP